MELFPIRSFRPVEAREDNADQDRTVLRLCEGFLTVPNGALCSGPNWQPIWGITDLPALITTVLSAANATKTHFVGFARGNHVWLIAWSKVSNTALGMFYVTTGTPADVDFASTSGVTIITPANAVYRDKDGALPWFASQIGDRVYFGNGTDDNLQWKDGALVALGPAGPPASIYDMSRVKMPACKSFVMAGNRSIFGAGNNASPKRVWITHPPSAAYPFHEGIYALETSFIDVGYSEATKVTALSAWQNYVTAHTDRKPVNLFDIDGASDGFKCVQAPGAANASAPAPSCVRDTNGQSSFYLGADGEVYKDEAIRVGPNDKRPARDQDIATTLGAGEWNREMKRPVVIGKAHTVYDRRTALYWMFAELSTHAGRFGLWAYNERSRTVSGPLRYPNALVSAAVAANADPGAIVGVVTAAGDFLYANLAGIGETEEFMQEPPAAALGAAYAQGGAAPTPTGGLSYVGMTVSDTAPAFVEMFAGGVRATLASVWSPVTSGGADALTRFWNNAYLARFETGYLDFGDAAVKKNYLELRMTLQRHSRAYVGLYAETEDGRRHGRWKGLVFPGEGVKAPLNLSGRRIRLRVIAVCFNAAPMLIRDLAIGWEPQGTT